jgi:hypothetical protein
LELGLGESRSDLERLAHLGIDLEDVGLKLEEEGIEIKSCETLLASIAKKQEVSPTEGRCVNRTEE